MKDRWKILITCLIVAFFLAILIGILSSSFKIVELRQYGILFYAIYNTVQNQDARSHGNYFVGLDHQFHTFPRGIVSIEFDTLTLTKDKSMVEVEGLFAGRLIKGQVMSMFTNYGFEWKNFLEASVEEYTREAIQAYSLSELISNRQAISNNVNRYVCLQLQIAYSWVQCDLVYLGRVGANIPEPELIDPEVSFELLHIELLQKQIELQKRVNVYKSGGTELLKRMQMIHSSLFNNISQALATSLGEVSDSQKQAAASYVIESARYPVLKHQFLIKL